MSVCVCVRCMMMGGGGEGGKRSHEIALLPLVIFVPRDGWNEFFLLLLLLFFARWVERCICNKERKKGRGRNKGDDLSF